MRSWLTHRSTVFRSTLIFSAALIYLHSTSDRQWTLADAVANRARAELGTAGTCDTSVARTGATEPDDQELDH
jgi:hypothetical protein